MLGRRDSEEERRRTSSSSSSSSLDTPTEPLPHLTQPRLIGSQKPARSESFKALLLRKGSRPDSSSRISAVERLRIVLAPPPTTDHQVPPPPPAAPDQDKPVRTPHAADDIIEHLTLDVPATRCGLSAVFNPRQRHPTSSNLLLTSSHFFFFSSHIRPRSLTPPCSASRRFTARCRLFSAPMTAIFEGDGEEEEEEVFEPPPGRGGGSGLRLVEISWWTHVWGWLPWRCSVWTENPPESKLFAFRIVYRWTYRIKIVLIRSRLKVITL